MPAMAVPRRIPSSWTTQPDGRPTAPEATDRAAPDRAGHGRAPTHQRPPTDRTAIRSEEHTSELQSRGDISYAVFFLKKKKNSETNTPPSTRFTYHEHPPHHYPV